MNTLYIIYQKLVLDVPLRRTAFVNWVNNMHICEVFKNTTKIGTLQSVQMTVVNLFMIMFSHCFWAADKCNIERTFKIPYACLYSEVGNYYSNWNLIKPLQAKLEVSFGNHDFSHRFLKKIDQRLGLETKAFVLSNIILRYYHVITFALQVSRKFC